MQLSLPCRRAPVTFSALVSMLQLLCTLRLPCDAGGKNQKHALSAACMAEWQMLGVRYSHGHFVYASSPIHAQVSQCCCMAPDSTLSKSRICIADKEPVQPSAENCARWPRCWGRLPQRLQRGVCNMWQGWRAGVADCNSQAAGQNSGGEPGLHFHHLQQRGACCQPCLHAC